MNISFFWYGMIWSQSEVLKFLFVASKPKWRIRSEVINSELFVVGNWKCFQVWEFRAFLSSALLEMVLSPDTLETAIEKILNFSGLYRLCEYLLSFQCA